MKFDVDVNYMYFLNGYSVDSNTVYYLSRVDMTYTEPTHTFVGQFVEGEEPAVEEENSDGADDSSNSKNA